MLAIHNLVHLFKKSVQVANAYAKLSKCQQFTTMCHHLFICHKLQTLMQSYQNVSNSQLILYMHSIHFSCKRLCKVIKMLAIHNVIYTLPLYRVVANAYAKLSKCQQFTTALIMRQMNFSCKRLCKVIKMLAIHNKRALNLRQRCVANAYAKLSKCQQFTTKKVLYLCIIKLQTLLQNYQNVSNSQLKRIYTTTPTCCKRLCKVIKMLAIHNFVVVYEFSAVVANAYAKLSKCQQFTTIVCDTKLIQKLQTLMQSYQNVSNSQLMILYS